MGTTQTSRTSSDSYPSSHYPLSGLNPAGFWLPLPPPLEPGHPLSATLYHTQTVQCGLLTLFCRLCKWDWIKSTLKFPNLKIWYRIFLAVSYSYHNKTSCFGKPWCWGWHDGSAELAVKPKNLGSKPPGETHDGRRESAPQSCLLTSTCALWHAWRAGRQADRQTDKRNLERKSGCLIFLDIISFR